MDYLYPSLAYLAQTLQICVDKLRSFIRNNTPCACNGQALCIKWSHSVFVYFINQPFLCIHVRIPQFFIRNITAFFCEDLRIFSPSCSMLIKQFLHFWRAPVDVMDSVRDGIDIAPLEHVHGNNSMNTRNSKSLVAHAHCKNGHREAILPRDITDMPWKKISTDSVCSLVIKSIVSSCYWCVRCKCTDFSHLTIFVIVFT